MSAMYDRIVALHSTKALRKSALHIRQGAGVFEWAMAGKGYRTALEIGTYRGVSAAEMSQYCDRVITIDLKRGKIETLGEKWDRVAFWGSLGISNIELKTVRNDLEKASLIKDLEFDFAFVDGAHDHTVANDFKLVKRCGHVLFHDADDNRLREKNPQAANHVFEFIDTLPKDEIEFKDIFALWTSGGVRG
jgi:predicted O-methyltransferase YrrM